MLEIKRRVDSNTRIWATPEFPEGLPPELASDAKFARIQEDDPRYGPPVMLLMGLDSEEVRRVQAMLRGMGGDFMQVKIFEDKMFNGTLEDAMHVEQPDITRISPADVPKMCFLSGLTGEEIMTVLHSFPETGLKSPVFAAMVPKNAKKTFQELIPEIMGDHERTTQLRKAPA